MKKVLALLVFSIFTFQLSIFSQNTTPSVDSIKTEIIETDSTVSIKSIQITTVSVNSQRISQEIERYKQEEKALEDKLKQVRNQLKEFERLLGGILVTERRIEDRKRKKLEGEKDKKTKNN